MAPGVFFVVHVWSDAHGFRATARDVMREDTEEFDDPDELARFLAVRAPEPPAPATDDEPDDQQ